MKKLIIFFLIVSVFFPFGALAQIETGEIEFDRLKFDKIPSVEAGEAIDFFRKAEELGTKIYGLVSKVWRIASSLIEEVTGLTMGEIFTGLINATIGIIETMIELLNGVI